MGGAAMVRVPSATFIEPSGYVTLRVTEPESNSPDTGFTYKGTTTCNGLDATAVIVTE